MNTSLASTAKGKLLHFLTLRCVVCYTFNILFIESFLNVIYPEYTVTSGFTDVCPYQNSWQNRRTLWVAERAEVLKCTVLWQCKFVRVFKSSK